ncbi:MAG: acetyl-CoA hydrolase/transferase C-terminal domain-containing protein [Oscillospiraceae bacterium]
MSWRDDYNRKNMSAADAAKLIKSGDRVFSTSFAPLALLNAIGDRYKELEDVWLYGDYYDAEVNLYQPEVMNGHFHRVCTFYGWSERAAVKRGCQMTAVITQYHRQNEFYRNVAKPNVALLNVSPPDEDGNFSLGLAPVDVEYVLQTAQVVIAQVNKNVPWIYSDRGFVNMSRLTAVVEADVELPTFTSPVPTEVDNTIAGYVSELIPNGACIQLGIGAAPNAVGYSLENHKDLGIHSEMYVEAMMHLTKKGAVNNSKKNLYRGLTVFGFGSGSQEMYDFMAKNPKIFNMPMEWINDPFTVAQIDNYVSVNTCFAVDILGQVSSESLAFTQYSGIGGQLDFVRGAQRSKNGKSFMVLRSTAEKSDGSKISKIAFTHAPGTAITTPRTDVHYVVTEYGVANLQNQTIEYRANALIEIAHPDFRDELRFNAKKAGLIF